MKRLHSYSEGERRRLQIVPWFSKKEWQETYQQAYSEDTELQEKAYTQMCIWKTRYSNLPLGVECTMSMLHVKLCDRQNDSSKTFISYQDRDLQLLYSTAVMRFLNQLTVMSNSKDSMYKMAEEHKIPDWLINLRHEAAHGNSVPALYLLRQASNIILQWLQEHYWKVEADVMEDVIKNNHEAERTDEQRKVIELLEFWVVLKMNHWAGVKTIDRIPNEDIRKIAMELANEEGCGIKRVTETKNRGKKIKKNDQIVAADSKKEVDIDLSGEYTHKIKTTFEPLLRRLFDPLKTKKIKKTRYQECLIECLVKFEAFTPRIDLDALDESEVLQLMSLQGELWKEVLESLQAHNLLHCLLRALIPHDTQIPTAHHLWLRLLAQLLSGEPPPQPPGTDTICQLLAESLPYDVDPMVLFHKVNLHYVKHQRPLQLKPASAKEAEVLQQLAQKVLDNPTRFTSTYLQSLLNYWEIPLNTNTKEKLCVLARIYNGRQAHKKRQAQVYTVASLLDHGLVINEPEDKIIDFTVQNNSMWKLYSGDADWSRHALGALPWDYQELAAKLS